MDDIANYSKKSLFQPNLNKFVPSAVKAAVGQNASASPGEIEEPSHIASDSDSELVPELDRFGNLIVNVEKGFKVTVKRLYPELDKLLSEKRLVSAFDSGSPSKLPHRLYSALRSHVFNNMPIRLLHITQMKLLGRNEVVWELANKMLGLDDTIISMMLNLIDVLGKVRDDIREPNFTDEPRNLEEDVREDPWKAICQYLFLRYARYAILSHTWLPSGEIEYSDTLRKDWWTLHVGSPGYRKLEGCCQAAAANDISLVWIDTLCINKDSSSELDESIQSMYKWYRDSSICITYLRDTTGVEDMELDGWFRRGWTLQELLAPKVMKFYGEDWTRLAKPPNAGNDKLDSALQHIVSEATGIPINELVSFDPMSGSSIATRMSWAASRATTRGEDRAYSLMGIFGVNFSISYGEGSERAFFRLIEAIISSRPTSYILQALNWSGKGISHTIHPSRLIPFQPECYSPDLELLRHDTGEEQEQYSSGPFLSDPMLLTHLGLRVKLLFIRIESYSMAAVNDDRESMDNRPYIVKLCLKPSKKSGYQETEVYLNKRFSTFPRISSIYDSPKRTAFGDSLFFGIYSFSEDEESDSIHLPTISYAFFLGLANPSRNFSISKLLPKHVQPTSKIDTRDMVRIWRIPPSSIATAVTSRRAHKIAMSDLAKCDMKLLYVYL